MSYFLSTVFSRSVWLAEYLLVNWFLGVLLKHRLSLTMQKSEFLDKNLGKEAMIFAFFGLNCHFAQIKKFYVAID